MAKLALNKLLASHAAFSHNRRAFRGVIQRFGGIKQSFRGIRWHFTKSDNVFREIESIFAERTVFSWSKQRSRGVIQCFTE